MEVVKIMLVIAVVAAALTEVVNTAAKAYWQKTEARLKLEAKAELMEAYKKGYLRYKAAYEKLLAEKTAAVQIPEGTVEAVRFAMAQSHPDNGGDPEKFRRYRDCYEKLTGRRQ